MKQEPIIYEIIEKWVDDNPRSEAGKGLMQLVLSLYNGREYPFAFSTCVKALDQTQRSWAVRLVLDYLAGRVSRTDGPGTPLRQNYPACLVERKASPNRRQG